MGLKKVASVINLTKEQAIFGVFHEQSLRRIQRKMETRNHIETNGIFLD